MLCILYVAQIKEEEEEEEVPCWHNTGHIRVRLQCVCGCVCVIVHEQKARGELYF